MIQKPDQPVLAAITSHWLSTLGAGLVTTSAISWILALPIQIRGHVSNPYIGILLFVLLPVVFAAGLMLIPAGVFLARRRVRAGVAAVVVDRQTSLRRLAVFLAVTTVFNVVIASQLTYRAVEHMETVQFCGQSCHAMKPEFTAYPNAVHSRVLCVECHVAPGAPGWVASKVSGTRQLLAVWLDNYHRPVTPALQSGRLVPSSGTCETCHYRQASAPVRLRVIPSFKEDERNTASKTVLLLLLEDGANRGIHGAHLGPGVQIRFRGDAKRESISWVQYRNSRSGETRTYRAAGSGDQPGFSTFEMQCVDCHNRPAHIFDLPERAMDRAMAAGQLSVSLPYLKKTGLRLLQTEYHSQAEAADKIPEGLRAYYRQAYPDVFEKQRKEVEAAAQTLTTIYLRNVFPDLKVAWGSYPNHLGHTDSPGCFRCHDDGHTTANKKTITQDCAVCHEMLAAGEADPEILKTLNLQSRIGAL